MVFSSAIFLLKFIPIVLIGNLFAEKNTLDTGRVDRGIAPSAPHRNSGRAAFPHPAL